MIPGEEQNVAVCGKTQLGLEFYESLALTVAIGKEVSAPSEDGGEDFR